MVLLRSSSNLLSLLYQRLLLHLILWRYGDGFFFCKPLGLNFQLETSFLQFPHLSAYIEFKKVKILALNLAVV